MPETKQRGRPSGVRNGQALTMPWVPLMWEPIYEQMVALHVTGWSYQTIGNHLGYSAQQVGNIIRSPEAQTIRASYLKSIRDNSELKLSELRGIATKRISDLLHNDELAVSAPFRMADVAKGILSGIGALNDGGDKTINNTLVLSPEGENKLIAAIEKSDRARQLNAGPTVKAE